MRAVVLVGGFGTRLRPLTLNMPKQMLPIVGKPMIEHVVENLASHGISVLNRITQGRRVSIEKETFPSLASDSALFAFQSESYWIDTGTPATYIQAQLDLLEGGVRGFTDSGIDPTAVISGAVEHSVVGAGVVIEEGAQVSGSVLLEGVRVERDAIVSDSVIGFQSSIGQNANITSFSIVGHGVNVQQGEEITESTLAR